MINLNLLRGKRWQVGSDSRLNQSLVDLPQRLPVSRWILWYLAEIEAKCAIELNINQARSDNLPFQVDRGVRHHVLAVEHLLTPYDLARR